MADTGTALLLALCSHTRPLVDGLSYTLQALDWRGAQLDRDFFLDRDASESLTADITSAAASLNAWVRSTDPLGEPVGRRAFVQTRLLPLVEDLRDSLSLATRQGGFLDRVRAEVTACDAYTALYSVRKTVADLLVGIQAQRFNPDAAGAIQETPPPAKSPTRPATIWYLGGDSFQVDDATPEMVTRTERAFLLAFLHNERRLSTKELQEKVPNVSATFKTLVTRPGFAAAMDGPGGRKGRGYFIRVRSRENP